MKDPEQTFASSGTNIVRFTLAVKRIGKKQENQPDADFIRVTAFSKTADLCFQYLHKGSKCGVEARVQTGSYQNKDGGTTYTTDFIVNNVEFLDSKKDSQAPAPKPEPAPSEPSGFAELDDSDMPF